MSKQYLSELISSTVFKKDGSKAVGVVGNVVLSDNFDQIKWLVLFDPDAEMEAFIVPASCVSFNFDNSLRLNKNVEPISLNVSGKKTNNPIGLTLSSQGDINSLDKPVVLGKVKDLVLDGFNIKSFLVGSELILTNAEFHACKISASGKTRKQSNKKTSKSAKSKQAETLKKEIPTNSEEVVQAVPTVEKDVPTLEEVAVEENTAPTLDKVIVEENTAPTLEEVIVEENIAPTLEEVIVEENTASTLEEDSLSINKVASNAEGTTLDAVNEAEVPSISGKEIIQKIERAIPSTRKKKSNGTIIRIENESKGNKSKDSGTLASKAEKTGQAHELFTTRNTQVPKQTESIDIELSEHIPVRIIADYAFLLGRIVVSDIYDFNNNKIISKNTLVVARTVFAARKAGKLLELTLKSRV